MNINKKESAPGQKPAQYESQRSALAPIARPSEERTQQYRAKGYYLDQTLGQFLEEACARYRPRPAAVGVSARQEYPGSSLKTMSWTYQDLEHESRLAAAHLRSLGAQPGDRVLIQLPNILEFLSYTVGIFRAGMVPVFCLPKHRERELEFFASQCDAAVHIFAQGAENCDYWSLYRNYSRSMEEAGAKPPRALDVTATLPFELNPAYALSPPVADQEAEFLSENTALFQLSGGTTGLSKMIPRTHADYLYSVRESARICQLTPQTRFLAVLPAAHNFLMSSPGILGVLYSGGTIVFAADPSPQTSFALIRQHKVTMVALVPALARAWALLTQRSGERYESLELIQVGGAKLSPTVAEQLCQVLEVKLQQVFGMAEGLVNYTRPDDSMQLVFNTQGRPISPDDEILVVDERGESLGLGQVGELLTRGPYTISGYYRDERANLESFTDDGFYRTGDLVRLHASGHLEVVGRAKDQINRAGEKISVDELEDFALGLAGVEDAVAIGLPDSQVGERICLVVLSADWAKNKEERLPWVRERYRLAGFADYKLPEHLEILSQFPLTKVGKISRKELRKQLSDLMSDSGS